MQTLLLCLACLTQPQNPPVEGPVNPPVVLTYAQASVEAVQTNKELWVYVGIPEKRWDGVITCETASLPGYPAQCIVVAVVRGGWLQWTRTMDANGRVIESEEVVQLAAPFQQQPIYQGRVSSANC